MVRKQPCGDNSSASGIETQCSKFYVKVSYGTKGFHLGLSKSGYVGASLKENVLVRASLKSDESSKLQFGLNGRQRLGYLKK